MDARNTILMNGLEFSKNNRFEEKNETKGFGERE